MRGTLTPCQRSAKSREGILLDRFDFAAQPRQAFAANLLQHVRITPFAVAAVRAEFAFQQFSLGVQTAQDWLDGRNLNPVAFGQFFGE